ncbi:hypothetical protein [Kineosporia babensis]|uniref:Uncharacterized protein n=1 Tax=Kineosporia babensis TaxID=499548 RepID=A0A9X1SXM9_9ACTN|nr:hypothetical protein [Kineosporia babensis]MCD5316392.1 hypothetical protein [Kineosporia babensis]
MLGADVVVGVLGSPAGKSGPTAKELHDLVAGKLAGSRGTNRYMAEFDAEARTPTGPSGWARDRVQYAVATAMTHDQAFATKVRSLLESLGAKG